MTSPEKMPPGDSREWEEFQDPELDPDIRAYLEELWNIDEKKFWQERELLENLTEDPSFVPALYFGFQLLLESHGFQKKGEVMERFDELSDRFTGQRKVLIEDQAKAIQELRSYLFSLGFTGKELSARETLKRAALPPEHPESGKGLRILQQISRESPSFEKSLEEFDREARAREERE